MEHMKGGELLDRIFAKSFFSETLAAQIVKDIASAVKYLHTKGITHRDLKLENLIFCNDGDDSPIKITDFGYSKMSLTKESTSMLTKCGTRGYVAPEILANKTYNSAVDMWSLGVIIYCLLCGFPPFYHENDAALDKLTLEGTFSFPSPFFDDISSEAKDLISRLLVVDPTQRLTASEVLQHPWISGEVDIPNTNFTKRHKERLKVMAARRRLQQTVRVIMMLNKINYVFFTTLLEEED